MGNNADGFIRMLLQDLLCKTAGHFHLIYILQGLPPDTWEGLQFLGPVADEALTVQKIFSQLAKYQLKMQWIGVNDHGTSATHLQNLCRFQNIIGRVKVL